MRGAACLPVGAATGSRRPAGLQIQVAWFNSRTDLHSSRSAHSPMIGPIRAGWLSYRLALQPIFLLQCTLQPIKNRVPRPLGDEALPGQAPERDQFGAPQAACHPERDQGAVAEIAKTIPP